MASSIDVARGVYELAAKIKETNVAISRMLMDAAGQLGLEKQHFKIIPGATYGEASKIIDRPDLWTMDSYGIALAPKADIDLKNFSNVVILCVQYHHETVILNSELWMAVAKVEKTKSLSYWPYWISAAYTSKWSDATLPDYGVWSPEKTISRDDKVRMKFYLGRQSLTSLPDSASLKKMLIAPIIAKWGDCVGN